MKCRLPLFYYLGKMEQKSGMDVSSNNYADIFEVS